MPLNESIRTFVTRVQGKAKTCGFIATSRYKCGCYIGEEVYYIGDAIKYVLLAEKANPEIKTSKTQRPRREVAKWS